MENKNETFTVKDKRFNARSEEEKEQIKHEEKFSSHEEKTPPLEENEPPEEINLTGLIFSLSHSALIQMGEFPNPMTNQKEKNIKSAKQTIDLISLLQEKTKGNVTKDEEALFSHVLYDLRMRFVQNVSNNQGK